MIFTGDTTEKLKNMIPAKYAVTIKAQTEVSMQKAKQKYGNKNLYEITFSNKGGLGNADHSGMDL